METEPVADNKERINLEQLRTEINQCDREILESLSKRMKLIPLVAEYKKANNIERYQPDRERQVVETRRKIAEETGINPDLVEKIMWLIIEDAHRIESVIIGK